MPQQIQGVSGEAALLSAGDWGIDPGSWHDTKEFRTQLIAQMDSFEPLPLTPEEESEWLAARRWIKDYSLEAVRKQMGLCE
jgi:hypothetical protein